MLKVTLVPPRISAGSSIGCSGWIVNVHRKLGSCWLSWVQIRHQPSSVGIKPRSSSTCVFPEPKKRNSILSMRSRNLIENWDRFSSTNAVMGNPRDSSSIQNRMGQVVKRSLSLDSERLGFLYLSSCHLIGMGLFVFVVPYRIIPMTHRRMQDNFKYPHLNRCQVCAERLWGNIPPNSRSSPLIELLR